MSKRGVFQLTRLTLNYCAHSGSSRGVRCVFCCATAPEFQTAVLCRSPERCPDDGLLTPTLRGRAFVAEKLDPMRAQHPELPLETALRPGQHPHALAEYGASPCLLFAALGRA